MLPLGNPRRGGERKRDPRRDGGVEIGGQLCRETELDELTPYDLRRVCAKLCVKQVGLGADPAAARPVAYGGTPQAEMPGTGPQAAQS